MASGTLGWSDDTNRLMVASSGHLLPYRTPVDSSENTVYVKIPLLHFFIVITIFYYIEVTKTNFGFDYVALSCCVNLIL